MCPTTISNPSPASRPAAPRTTWVDAEVHLFPPEWCTPDFAPPEHESTLRRVVYEHPEREAALNRATVDDLLEEMERTAVDRAVVMGLPWRDPALCREHDAYIADCVRRYPDQLTGLGLLPAPGTGDLRDEVRRMHEEQGLTGVKVIPSWQGYALDDHRLEPALAELESRGLVFMSHIDHLFVRPGEGELPYQLLEVARRHPDLRIVAPHLGGLLCLYHLHEPIRPLLRNMLFVTTVPLTMPMVRFAVEAAGPDRVAFGTDYPFNPSHDMASVRAEFESLEFPASTRDAIAGDSALRFLGITP